MAFGQHPGVTALAARASAPEKDAAAARGLSVANKKWTGDFDKMLERRMIRVDAPFSRSLYFNDNGRERGLAARRFRLNSTAWQGYSKACPTRAWPPYCLGVPSRSEVIGNCCGNR